MVMSSGGGWPGMRDISAGASRNLQAQSVREGRASSKTVLLASGEVPRLPFHPPARDDNGEGFHEGNRRCRSIGARSTYLSIQFFLSTSWRSVSCRAGGGAGMRDISSDATRKLQTQSVREGRASSKMVLFASGEVPRLPFRPPARDDKSGACLVHLDRVTDRSPAHRLTISPSRPSHRLTVSRGSASQRYLIHLDRLTDATVDASGKERGGVRWISAKLAFSHLGTVFAALTVSRLTTQSSPSCLLTISPSHHLTVSPSHRLTVSPSHRLTISPSHHLTVSPSHRLTVSPSHRLPPSLTVSPSHRLTVSPSHHLTVSLSPSHHLTVSPSHRLTISPSHRLTVSPSHHLTVSPSHLHLSPLTVSPLTSHHLTISPSRLSPLVSQGRHSRPPRATWKSVIDSLDLLTRKLDLRGRGILSHVIGIA